MGARKALLAVPLIAAFVLALEVPGCHASSAVGAVAMTSMAGGVSAVRRANGECYIDCLPGTTCNRATGLCDPLDCQGKCGDGFVCEESGTGSSCVPREQSQQVILAPREVPSGAQPYGDSVAAQPAHGAAVISGGGAVPTSSDLSARDSASSDTSISTRAGASGSSPSGTSTPAAFAVGNSSNGSSAGASDGGVARVPAAALQIGMPARSKDVPTRSNSVGPSLENGWDPSQPAPVPQMDNPNQPPPH